MGYYYQFYDPEHDFKLVDEGEFAGMPFYWTDCPVMIPMVYGDIGNYFEPNYIDPYNCTGLLSRDMAIELQKYMDVNKTIFTDMMDEAYTDTLVFRIT